MSQTGIFGSRFNLFQCDSGNVDRWDSLQGMYFNRSPWNFVYSNSGQLYNRDHFQHNSGNIYDRSPGTACTVSIPWHIQDLTFRSDCISGAGGLMQFQWMNQDAGKCSEFSGDGLLQACDNREMVSYGGTVENAEMNIFYNFSFSAETCCEGRQVAMIGTEVFRMVNRLTATGWSWLHMAFQTLALCTGLQLAMVACTITAVLCLALYFWKGMGHLSCNGETQCRLQKRRLRRDSSKMQRQLVAVILLCGLTNVKAMEDETLQDAVLQRMASMAEAATRAAMAAEEALKRTTAASSSSGGTNPHEGLSAASRILKPPDTFNGEDIMLFQQWKHQFTSWLCFGDNRYAEALDLVEKKDTAPAWSSYNEDERSMAQKLYAVLTSYMRGKCAHMVRAESKVKDGFKLWFNLNHEFMPSTRQRRLALAQALGSYILHLAKIVHHWSPS